MASSGFVLAFLLVFSSLLLTVVAPSVSFGRARCRPAATRGAAAQARNDGILVPTASTGGNRSRPGSTAASGPLGSGGRQRTDASGGPSTAASGGGARGGRGPRGPGSGGPRRTGGDDDDGKGEGRDRKRASHKDREVVSRLQNVTSPAELIGVVSRIELPESGKIQLITLGFNKAKIKETVTNAGVPLTREEWREVVDQVQRENPDVAIALASATLGARPASQVRAINALVAADGKKAIEVATRAVVTSGVGKARVNEAFKRRAAQKAEGKLGGTTYNQEQEALQSLIDAITVATSSRNQGSQTLSRARTALDDVSPDTSVHGLIDAAKAALRAQMPLTEIVERFRRLADLIPEGPVGAENITRADVLRVGDETAEARQAALERVNAKRRQKPEANAGDQMDD